MWNNKNVIKDKKILKLLQSYHQNNMLCSRSHAHSYLRLNRFVSHSLYFFFYCLTNMSGMREKYTLNKPLSGQRKAFAFSPQFHCIFQAIACILSTCFSSFFWGKLGKTTEIRAQSFEILCALYFLWCNTKHKWG